jgi:hypothetical protein
MNAPIKPRYTYVDSQLDFLEQFLHHTLLECLLDVDRGYWYEVDAISREDEISIENAVALAFAGIRNKYATSARASAMLVDAQILIQNCAWAAMSIPYPNNPVLHARRVTDNALEVFYRQIYANLRTELIMIQHNAEVVQRTWRRCVTNPLHPVCKRRLDREFNDATEGLKNAS